MEFSSIDYLLDESAKNGLPIGQIVLREEQRESGAAKEAIMERIARTWQVMKNVNPSIISYGRVRATRFFMNTLDTSTFNTSEQEARIPSFLVFGHISSIKHAVIITAPPLPR